jgi:uncharacterized Fe-S center protein
MTNGPYSLKPGIVKDKCTGCGRCISICPKKTIRMAGNKACIDDDGCIRCYCCHEICLNDAVDLRRSIAGSVIARIAEGK